MADTVRELLAGRPRINLLPPLDHRAMVMAMRRSTIIMSDSGGVQEEAPALGVPLLILRSKTERPEGIRSGNSKLVGTDTKLIVAEVERLLGDTDAHAPWRCPLYLMATGTPRSALPTRRWPGSTGASGSNDRGSSPDAGAFRRRSNARLTKRAHAAICPPRQRMWPLRLAV